MQEEPTNIDILVARALAGEANRAELEDLNAWRAADPANEAHYQTTVKVIKTLSSEEFAPDVEAAWQNLDRRISQDNGRVVRFFRGRPFWFAAAALLTVTFGIALLTGLFRSASEQVLVVSASGPATESRLPDGSTALLSENSELRYTRAANGERQAILKGEAFFEVVHNDDEPFVVVAGEVRIKDIGTAFNVKALPGDNVIHVFVESGEVRFYSTDNDGLRLVKGEHASYNRQEGTFTRQSSVPMSSLRDFRSRTFEFADSRLQDVIQQLNAVYGTHIAIADRSLGECRLSVRFSNEPIDVVLEVITETLDLEVSAKGDTLMLTGNGCR